MALRLSLLVGACFGFVQAGSFVPTQAVLVNEKGRRSDVDLRKNGLLAFRCDTAFNVGARVDLRRVADGELYRIALDARFGAAALDSARRAARWIAPGLALQQLPEGRYAPTRIFLGSDVPMPFTGDTLTIRAGKVTSLGEIRMVPTRNLVGYLVELDVRTVGRGADAWLKRVPDYGIDTMAVSADTLLWKIEKGTLHPLK